MSTSGLKRKAVEDGDDVDDEDVRRHDKGKSPVIMDAPLPLPQSDDDDSGPFDPGSVDMNAYTGPSDKGTVAFCEESLAALRISVETSLQSLRAKVQRQVESLETVKRIAEENVLLYRLAKRKFMSELRDEHAKIQRMCHQFYHDVICATLIVLPPWEQRDDATAMRKAAPQRPVNAPPPRGVYNARRNQVGPIYAAPELSMGEATPQRPVYTTPQRPVYTTPQRPGYSTPQRPVSTTPQYAINFGTLQHVNIHIGTYATPNTAMHAIPQTPVYRTPQLAQTSQRAINQETQRIQTGEEAQSPIALFKAALSRNTQQYCPLSPRCPQQHNWTISYTTAEYILRKVNDLDFLANTTYKELRRHLT